MPYPTTLPFMHKLRPDPIGPTPLTEAYLAVARRWYAEGKTGGPNSAALLDLSHPAWDAMSPGEREYARQESVRIEREYR